MVPLDHLVTPVRPAHRPGGGRARPSLSLLLAAALILGAAGRAPAAAADPDGAAREVAESCRGEHGTAPAAYVTCIAAPLRAAAVVAEASIRYYKAGSDLDRLWRMAAGSTAAAVGWRLQCRSREAPRFTAALEPHIEAALNARRALKDHAAFAKALLLRARRDYVDLFLRRAGESSAEAAMGLQDLNRAYEEGQAAIGRAVGQLDTLVAEMQSCGGGVFTRCAKKVAAAEAILREARATRNQPPDDWRRLGTDFDRLNTRAWALAAEIDARAAAQRETWLQACAGPDETLDFDATAALTAAERDLAGAEDALLRAGRAADSACSAGDHLEAARAAREAAEAAETLDAVAAALRGALTALAPFEERERTAIAPPPEVGDLEAEQAQLARAFEPLRAEIGAAREPLLRGIGAAADDLSRDPRCGYAETRALIADLLGERDALAIRPPLPARGDVVALADLLKRTEKQIGALRRHGDELVEIREGRYGKSPLLYDVCRVAIEDLGGKAPATTGPRALAYRADMTALERATARAAAAAALVAKEAARARRCMVALEERKRAEEERLARAETAVRGCAFAEAAGLIEGLPPGARRDELAARLEGLEAAESRSQELVATAAEREAAGDLTGADAALKKARGLTPCQQSAAAIGRALERLAATAEKAAEKAYGEAEARIAACAFAEGRDLIAALAPGPRRDELAARLADGEAAEEHSRALVAAAAKREAGGDLAGAAAELRKARDLTPCDFSAAAIDRTLDRLAVETEKRERQKAARAQARCQQVLSGGVPVPRPDGGFDCECPEGARANTARTACVTAPTAGAPEQQLARRPEPSGGRWQCFVWFTESVFFGTPPPAPGLTRDGKVIADLAPERQVALLAHSINRQIEFLDVAANKADMKRVDYLGALGRDLIGIHIDQTLKSEIPVLADRAALAFAVLQIIGGARPAPDFLADVTTVGPKDPVPSLFTDWRCDKSLKR